MLSDFSGKFAEYMAIFYLYIKGYRLVKHNYITGRGTGAGEIDIIVKKRHLLVFVEVKKRGDLANAAYAIQPKQQQRIRRAAENFVAKHQNFANFDIRFDAILVKPPFCLQHIIDAF